MKNRYFLLPVLALVVAVSACSKADETGVVGGRSEYYDYSGRSYMMGIADNLVTDALDQLEKALEVNDRGGSRSSHFDMTGDLMSNGVMWTVTESGNRLYGMTLKKGTGDAWMLVFDGNYAVGEDDYPTRFTLRAERGAQNAPYHFNWTVTLNGERVERGGYSCQAETTVPLQYQLGVGYNQSTSGWNMMYGTLMMSVYKDSKLIDLCELVFNGNPGSAKYTRGL